MRKTIILSVWFKLVLLGICAGVLYVHYSSSADYFNPSLSVDQQHQAVEAVVDVDVRNNLGLTGLMFAAIYGEKELAQTLIDRGAHLNLQSPDEQQTALHYVTNNLRSTSTIPIGGILVDAYASTRLKNKFDDTPLHLVISTDVIEDRQKMVDLLMKNGADINAQTSQGDTLLHLAVNMQAYNWVPTLLQKYGSIMSRSIKNQQGLTPREYAAQLGFGEMATLVGDVEQPLIGAAVYDGEGLTGLMLAIMGNNQKIIESYMKEKAALDLRSNDVYQNSALHVAILQENIDAVQALIANGANGMIQNAKGEIPLQYIVRVSDPGKKIKIAEIILGKYPDALLAPNKRGDTLVHYLVRYDETTVFEYLSKKYRPLMEKALQVKNAALETPISLASRFSRQAIARLIQSMNVAVGK